MCTIVKTRVMNSDVSRELATLSEDTLCALRLMYALDAAANAGDVIEFRRLLDGGALTARQSSRSFKRRELDVVGLRALEMYQCSTNLLALFVATSLQRNSPFLQMCIERLPPANTLFSNDGYISTVAVAALYDRAYMESLLAQDDSVVAMIVAAIIMGGTSRQVRDVFSREPSVNSTIREFGMSVAANVGKIRIVQFLVGIGPFSRERVERVVLDMPLQTSPENRQRALNIIRGLGDTTVTVLPVLNIHPHVPADATEDNTCPICFESLESGVSAHQCSLCHKEVCMACAQLAIMATGNKCPLCKSDVPIALGKRMHQ